MKPRIRRIALFAILPVLIAPSTPPGEREGALHVVKRLTFGPRPGDVDRVLRIGVDRWIEQQLNPAQIRDDGAADVLEMCDELRVSLVPTAPTGEPPRKNGSYVLAPGSGVVPGGKMNVPSMRHFPLRFSPRTIADAHATTCALLLAERSDRQLEQVMRSFWENHFYVHGLRVPGRGAMLQMQRVAIAPHALGRFRDLLGAVAQSPALLQYLDNWQSRAEPGQPTLVKPDGRARVASTGLNENFARELLELHTLGVDGGYTQSDVVNVARAFTGWTHDRPTSTGFLMYSTMTPLSPDEISRPRFLFDAGVHDAAEKVVLGHTLPAGRGLEDGQDVLDILARHPSTAHFIARKLAVRFISDAPPESVVQRAAETFTRTDGDISAVVRTIVTSPEFMTPAAYDAKTKTPVELLLSARRALAAPMDTAGQLLDLLHKLDQAPFSHLTPEGWPDTGPDWLNAGTLTARLNLAVRIADGDIASIPVQSWPAWKNLVNASFNKQVDGVIQDLLQDHASPALRSALLASRPDSQDSAARERALRRLIALALGSADFQKR